MERATTLFEISALTHVGAVRASNEDAVAVAGELITESIFGPKRFVFPVAGKRALMVADGMGGHSHGALASRVALSSLIASSAVEPDEAGWLSALHRANDAVYDRMDEYPSARGMGSTVVGAVLDGASLIYFNVGDSRAYLYSLGRLVRLSHDDVPFAEGGAGSFRSHQITQSLGGLARRTSIRPHVGTVEMQSAEDVLLLCSDGLTDLVGESDIAAAIGTLSDVGQCAAWLLQTAMANGGSDNISIILARQKVA